LLYNSISFTHFLRAFILCPFPDTDCPFPDTAPDPKYANSEAMDAFTAKPAQYSGTPMEVEMLARVATLYGLYLNDKEKAKEIAVPGRRHQSRPGMPAHRR
jgi:hypothetical protein